jgi:hypothetical protein
MRGKAYGKIGMMNEAIRDLKTDPKLSEAFAPDVRNLFWKTPF